MRHTLNDSLRALALPQVTLEPWPWGLFQFHFLHLFREGGHIIMEDPEWARELGGGDVPEKFEWRRRWGPLV